MRSLALVAALVASLLIPPATAAGPELIRDPQALKALFSGRTVYGRFLDGSPWTEYYSPDGRAAYVQLQCLHSGNWWITRLSQTFGSIEAGTPIACFSYPTQNAPGDAFCFAVGGSPGRERFYPVHGHSEYTGIPAAIAERWADGNAEALPLDQDGCPSV